MTEEFRALFGELHLHTTGVSCKLSERRVAYGVKLEFQHSCFSFTLLPPLPLQTGPLRFCNTGRTISLSQSNNIILRQILLHRIRPCCFMETALLFLKKRKFHFQPDATCYLVIIFEILSRRLKSCCLIEKGCHFKLLLFQ